MGIKFSRKKLKLIVAILVIAVVIGLAVLYIMRLLNQPANGTVIRTGPTALTTPQPSYRTLDSKYFTARYSGRFGLAASAPKTSASLQAWTLVAHQEAGIGESSKISVIVASLPIGGVTEDGTYKLFAAYPELYTISEATYGGDQVVVAKRIKPTYQQTVLWSHNGFLLTVTLSAASETDLVNGELDSLLTSLKWR